MCRAFEDFQFVKVQFSLTQRKNCRGKVQHWMLNLPFIAWIWWFFQRSKQLNSSFFDVLTLLHHHSSLFKVWLYEFFWKRDLILRNFATPLKCGHAKVRKCKNNTFQPILTYKGIKYFYLSGCKSIQPKT